MKRHRHLHSICLLSLLLLIAWGTCGAPVATAASSAAAALPTAARDPATEEALWSLYDNTGGSSTWLHKWSRDKGLCGQFGVTCIGSYYRLWVPANGLAGSLPRQLFCSGHLLAVNVAHNSLAGALSVPSTAADCGASGAPESALQLLNVGHNSLSGAVPQGLFSPYFGNLTTMYLEKNNFTGTLPEIPDTVGVAPDLHRSSLRVLWLEHNKGLHGTVPPSWQRLSLLQALVAAHCSFNSTVGAVLAPLVAKDRACYRNSPLLPSPDSADAPCNCVELRELDFSHNVLTGSIPNAIAYLRGLVVFNLQNNRLSGPLPSFQLGVAALQGSPLTQDHDGDGDVNGDGEDGAIYNTNQGFLNPLALVSFSVADNEGITGAIPEGLGQLQYLESITLTGTSLYSPTLTLPSFLTYSTTAQLRQPSRRSTCPVIVGTNSKLTVILDASYVNYAHCICDSGTYGGHGVCIACPSSCVCKDNIVSACYPSPELEEVSNTGLYLNATTNASNPLLAITECPRFGISANNATACNPDGHRRFTCGPGHVQDSHLCGACTKGYYAVGYTCNACKKFMKWLLPIVYIIAFCGFLVYLWREGSRAPKTRQISALSITLWYLQVIFGLLITGNWIMLAFSPVDFITSMAAFAVYAVDCIGSSATAWWWSWLFTMLMPVIVTTLGATIHLVTVKCQLTSREYSQKKCLHMVIMFLDYWYFPCCLRIWRATSCWLADGTNRNGYLVSHPAVLCYDYRARFTSTFDVVVRFDLAFSLIYMIGYPVAVASVLCSKLHTRYESIKQPEKEMGLFPMLFINYKPDRWWWRILVILRKGWAAFFIVATPFYDPAVMFGMLLVVLQIGAALTHYFHPYAQTRDNRLEMAVSYALMFTCIAGLVTSSAVHESDLIAKAVIWLCIAINLFMIAAILLVFAVRVTKILYGSCSRCRRAAIRNGFIRANCTCSRDTCSLFLHHVGWQDCCKCCDRPRRPRGLTSPLSPHRVSESVREPSSSYIAYPGVNPEMSHAYPHQAPVSSDGAHSQMLSLTRSDVYVDATEDSGLQARRSGGGGGDDALSAASEDSEQAQRRRYTLLGIGAGMQPGSGGGTTSTYSDDEGASSAGRRRGGSEWTTRTSGRYDMYATEGRVSPDSFDSGHNEYETLGASRGGRDRFDYHAL